MYMKVRKIASFCSKNLTKIVQSSNETSTTFRKLFPFDWNDFEQILGIFREVRG